MRKKMNFKKNKCDKKIKREKIAKTNNQEKYKA